MKWSRVVALVVLIGIMLQVSAMREMDTVFKKTDLGYDVRKWEISFPTANIDLIARGYNMAYGNPMETSVGGDQGYRQLIFQIDTSAEAVVPDWRVVKPKKIQINSKISCSSRTSETTITDSTSLQTEIGKSAISVSMGRGSIGGRMGGLLGGASGRKLSVSSTSFKQMSSILNSNSFELIKTEASCSVYEARLNYADLPAFHPTFLKAVDTLPDTYDQEHTDELENFVETYGTNYLTYALFGSKYGKMYQVQRTSSESSFSQSSESRSASYSKSKKSSNYLVHSSKTKTVKKTKKKKKSEQSREQSLKSKSVNEFQYAVGARPADDVNEWIAESEADPGILRFEMARLDELIFNKINKAKGKALALYLSHYEPTGAMIPKKYQLGKCYIAKNRHISLTDSKAPKSIVAQCRQGSLVIGGAFQHLWNFHGDVTVNAAATEIAALTRHIKNYNRARNQELEINFIMSKGARMMQDFAKEFVLNGLAKLFGDRINPTKITQFLSGKLNSLGLEKREALSGIINGMKVFGNSSLGNHAEDLLKNNPYAKSIFEISDSMMRKLDDQKKEMTQALAGEVELGIEDIGQHQENQETLEHHADILVEAMRHLDKVHGTNLLQDDDTQALIFDKISKWVGKAMNHIQDVIGKVVGPVSKAMSHALKIWGDFSGQFDMLRKRFKGELNAARNRRVDSKLFQDLMAHINSGVEDPHGKTLLATRNSLSWMFPHGDSQFVCGSGLLGTRATRRSSFGYCSALCAFGVYQDWNMKTVSSRTTKVSREKKTVTVEAQCPSGYSVVSGGFMHSSYVPNRFVQITKAHPTKSNSFVCEAKWTETQHNEVVPEIKCYARCSQNRRTNSGMECKVEETLLVNGHGSALCQDGYQALGGGWSVDSIGVTYFKQSAYVDLQDVEGAKGYRCEFGTSHSFITGKCYASCCKYEVLGLEREAIAEPERCVKEFHKKYDNLGSFVKYGDIIRGDNMMMSRNGKFYMVPLFDRQNMYFQVYEVNGCRAPRALDHITFDYSACNKLADNWFTRKWGTQHWNAIMKGLEAKVTENGLALRRRRDTDPCQVVELTKGTIGRIQLLDNGDLVFQDDNAKPLRSFRFSKCVYLYKKFKAVRSQMHMGEMMLPGQALVSDNKEFTLQFGLGGGLTLFHQRLDSPDLCVKPTIVFSTIPNMKTLEQLENYDRHVKTGWTLRLNEDNNLVISDASGNTKWETKTSGNGLGQGKLELTNDGVVKLVDALEEELWTLKLGKVQECELIREELKLRGNVMGTDGVMDTQAGGLVSNNKEYVLHVRPSPSQDLRNTNLEIWRDGSRADCVPTRFCTLASGISKASVTPKGLIGETVSGKTITLWKFKDPKHKLMNIKLTDGGHLLAIAGKDGRTTHYEQINIGTCLVKHQAIQKDTADPYHCGAINVKDSMGTDSEKYAKCPTGYLVKGWHQASTVDLNGIDHLKCCKDPKLSSENVECQNIDIDFSKKGMVSCPQGFVINGFMTNGSKLHNLKKLRCCRSKERRADQQKCRKANRWQQSEEIGDKQQCTEEGYYLQGVYREDPARCHSLKCLRELNCCTI